uniref:Uncharacterized protein n=1 Tax=Ditylenchus dipsaci TaxID=166011 RepID=A0A915DZ06_9BILA
MAKLLYHEVTSVVHSSSSFVLGYVLVLRGREEVRASKTRAKALSAITLPTTFQYLAATGSSLEDEIIDIECKMENAEQRLEELKRLRDSVDLAIDKVVDLASMISIVGTQISTLRRTKLKKEANTGAHQLHKDSSSSPTNYIFEAASHKTWTVQWRP